MPGKQDGGSEMNRKPRLLDLFCGAGGCAVGYSRAGFEVVGVDIEPQPRYPFDFIGGNALEVMRALLRSGGIEGDKSGRVYMLNDFSAIHASPPCQRYSKSKFIHDSGSNHPDLIEETRQLLELTGLPWVMENAPCAPLRNPAILCGLAFGLKVIRHRKFEASFLLMAPPHHRHPRGISTGTNPVKRGGKGNGYSTGADGLVCVAGHNFNRAAGADAMGIDWPMTQHELAQAIPPAYTKFVGERLIEVLS